MALSCADFMDVIMGDIPVVAPGTTYSIKPSLPQIENSLPQSKLEAFEIR